MTQYRKSYESERQVLDYYQDVKEKCPCCGHEKYVKTQYLYSATDPLNLWQQWQKYVKESRGLAKLENKLIGFDPEVFKPK